MDQKDIQRTLRQISIENLVIFWDLVRESYSKVYRGKNPPLHFSHVFFIQLRPVFIHIIIQSATARKCKHEACRVHLPYNSNQPTRGTVGTGLLPPYNSNQQHHVNTVDKPTIPVTRISNNMG